MRVSLVASPVSSEQESDAKTHRLTKTGPEIRKMLRGLMSLSFCCEFQMVESQFGVNIHPACY